MNCPMFQHWSRKTAGRRLGVFLLLGLLIILGNGRAASWQGQLSEQPWGEPGLAAFKLAAPVKPYALVYNGPASAEDAPEAAAAVARSAGLPVRYVADLDELPGRLENARVFIIGGTQDDMSPLLEAFTPETAGALRAYLRRGGRYLGICGGGFMASTGWQDGEDFIDALGIIPAESADYDSNYAPRVIPVRWSGQTRRMYFQAGPIFELVKSKETVRVIATYADGRIAALISSYGKGKVAVSGPHPEARQAWREEVPGSGNWPLSTDLAVNLLNDLLSDSPIRIK